MISKPQFGWAQWELDNFKDFISYVDDFPFNLFDKLWLFFKDGECQSLEFDAEGHFYTLYLGSPVYIETEKGEFIKIFDNIEDFIEKFLEDIERDIDDWAIFPSYVKMDELLGDKEDPIVPQVKHNLEAGIKNTREELEKWKKSQI